MRSILALLISLAAGCAAPVRQPPRAPGVVPLHKSARVGQFCLYRVWSDRIAPVYQSITVIGRVGDLLVVEHDEGDGLLRAHLVAPSVPWTPGSDRPNVRRAFLCRYPDLPVRIEVEDRGQVAARQKKELSAFDSELTITRTRPFEDLRLAGRGWKGELVTVRSGPRVLARTWRARQAWFSGVLRQELGSERFVLHTMGENGAAGFPLAALLERTGWVADAARAAPRWKHHGAEALTLDGRLVRYYWPDPKEQPRIPDGTMARQPLRGDPR